MNCLSIWVTIRYREALRSFLEFLVGQQNAVLVQCGVVVLHDVQDRLLYLEELERHHLDRLAQQADVARQDEPGKQIQKRQPLLHQPFEAARAGPHSALDELAVCAELGEVDLVLVEQVHEVCEGAFAVEHLQALLEPGEELVLSDEPRSLSRVLHALRHEIASSRKATCTGCEART